MDLIVRKFLYKTLKFSFQNFAKTEMINEEIENALKTAQSKNGGTGTNYPDIKLFIQTFS